jgi:hypothetical protein
MAGGSGASLCAVRPRRVSSLDAHDTVLQAEILTISTCAKDCNERIYIIEHIYILLR